MATGLAEAAAESSTTHAPHAASVTPATTAPAQLRRPRIYLYPEVSCTGSASSSGTGLFSGQSESWPTVCHHLVYHGIPTPWCRRRRHSVCRTCTQKLAALLSSAASCSGVVIANMTATHVLPCSYCSRPVDVSLLQDPEITKHREFHNVNKSSYGLVSGA